MNVKAGDVAMIIKGRPHNQGRIVLVTSFHGEVDYSLMGYGQLPCWEVESLGEGDLETLNGKASTGFTPDLSLLKLPDITQEQAEAMRKAKAQHKIDAALQDLAVILEAYEVCERAKAKSKTVRGAVEGAHISERSMQRASERASRSLKP